jgi:catechol 2,3-dioxygenase-like lactoylglutathione lyase family enzyme
MEVSFINLYADNVDELRVFYRDVLGLKELEGNKEIAKTRYPHCKQ